VVAESKEERVRLVGMRPSNMTGHLVFVRFLGGGCVGYWGVGC
jgi:hypothetical protein